MSSVDDDLVTHLLLENRKLRRLYLAEQQKAMAERKRRITAEARVAALLSKKVVNIRMPNSSHRPAASEHSSVTVDGVGVTNLPRSDRNPDSYSEDRIALLIMNNMKKFQKCVSVSESSTQSVTCCHHLLPEQSVVGSSGRPDLTRMRNVEPCPLNDKTNSSHFVSRSREVQINFQKPKTPPLSSFWLFIDMNGKTRSSVEPPLNSVQQMRKEAFIRRSTERQIRIQEASARRRELAAQKRKVAKQLLSGQAVNRDAVKVLGRMDREICAFPPQTMKRETVRRIHKTKEFQEKKKRRREDYDMHINRLLAYCYSQVPYGSTHKY